MVGPAVEIRSRNDVSFSYEWMRVTECVTVALRQAHDCLGPLTLSDPIFSHSSREGDASINEQQNELELRGPGTSLLLEALCCSLATKCSCLGICVWEERCPDEPTFMEWQLLRLLAMVLLTACLWFLPILGDCLSNFLSVL